MGTLCPTKEPMSSNQKYLKRSEVGQLLGMSVKAVARLRDLKAIHLNKRLIRYDREDVLCWLNRRKTNQNAATSSISTQREGGEL